MHEYAAVRQVRLGAGGEGKFTVIGGADLSRQSESKLQDEEMFLKERQQQLENDLNELKRRQELVRLEKLEWKLQVRASGR